MKRFIYQVLDTVRECSYCEETSGLIKSSVNILFSLKLLFLTFTKGPGGIEGPMSTRLLIFLHNL